MTASYTKLIPSIAVLASIVLALPTFALADDGAPAPPMATQPGIVDPSVGVPETSGQSQTEQIATTSVDPSTGIAQISIAFKSPKARGLAQPGVSLSYGSESGMGYAGWGWDLTIPSIVRRPLSGPPNFDPAPSTVTTSWVPKDQYFFGGKRLVPICLIEEGGCANLPQESLPVEPGWWYFREAEDSSFDRYFLSKDQQTWVIQSKSGLIRELGKPLIAGTSVPAASVPPATETTATPAAQNNLPYRWSIVRAYDSHPLNIVYYVWSGSPGTRLYLTDIYDTPSATAGSTFFANFAHHIKFNYEDPPTLPWQGVNPPIWRAVPVSRLAGVDVTSARFNDYPGQREMVRRYHLAYNETGIRSYLASVTLEGECVAPMVSPTGPIFESSTGALPTTTNCTTRPPTEFTWEQPLPNEILTQSLTGTVPTNAYMVDVNSDGIPDFAQPAPSSGKTGTVEITKGNSVGAQETLSINVLASGATEQNFFADPKATALNFTAGNFDGTGSTNAAWFSSAANGSSVYPFTSYAPVAWGGTGWQWQQQNVANISLLPSAQWYPDNQQVYACAPSTLVAGEAYGYAAAPETPYGTADIDGDGYPDLLTYQAYVKCVAGCSTSSPINCGSPSVASIYIGVGLYTTVKNPDGSLVPFALHHGTVSPSSPFSSIVPASTKYMQFLPLTDLTARLIPEDVNGDGLPDLMAVSTKGIAVEYGMGDGTLSYVGSADAGATPPMLDVPGLTIKDPSKIYVHDVNGDGLADILLLANGGTSGIEYFLGIDGSQFAQGIFLDVPLSGLTTTNTRLSFGDMNGSGVDDIVVVQDGGSGNNAYYIDLLDSIRPGLIHVVSNGLGATTWINYQSTSQLDAAATAAGTPWARHVPQILHHVTSLAKLNGLPGIYAQQLNTNYTYTNPVYDPRDQRFVGFQQVRRDEIGGGNDPSGSVMTTYLTGICALDGEGATCPAQSADRPFLPLTGAPVLVETFDESGNYLSSVHTTYEVKEVETGTDGTFARFSLPTTVDTYLYDTSAPATTTTSTITVAATFPDSNEPVGQFNGSITLHGTATHVQRSTTYDVYGNVLTTQDVGIVGGTDQTITVTSTWTLAGNAGAWLWRKQTETLTPFTSTGVFADPGRATTYTYSAQGDLRIVQVGLNGNVALNRYDALGRTTASPPSDASQSVGVAGTLIEVSHHEFDQYGNISQSMGPNGVSCEQITYDPQFSQLPITDVVYTASPGTCSGAGITTSVAYNRGFAAPTVKTDPGGPFTQTQYDQFGRTYTVTKSSPTSVVQLSPEAAQQMTYLDTPYEAVNTMTWDGTAYRATWAYIDGLGNSILNLKEAAGHDPGTWIASGIQQRGGRGHVIAAYLPYFVSSIQPSNLSLSALQPTSAARQTQYDGFGRPLFTYTYDGAQDSATSYHAVSTDVYDANHLPSFTDPFPTTTQKDGHGRVVLTQVSGRIGQNSAVTTVQTRSIYTAAGNLTTLSRTSGGTTVTQSIAYDSLGRMVENREPNTTTGTNDWRYVYNDSGELVGTSDPRGCGENIAYDAAGREVSEDYSPCAANQVEYSPPLGTGAGLETLYVYDAPVGSTPTSPDGRLYGTISRGEFTQFTYDPRGRKQTVTRTLALPGVPASDWHERFSKSSYSYTIGYDDADRVVTQGTGATALAVGGASTVTTGYDERGNIYSLTSSYGNLVTSAAFEADGQLLNYQYADHAQTLAQRDYNSLRRLWHSNVGRSPAWVQNGAIYTQPSGGTTLESILEAKTFTYDPVGNPVIIADSSGTTVWPAGAARMTRTVGYDDFYHVTSVADNTGGDAFIQPYAPEFAGTTDAPMPATLASTRIVSQTFNYDWLGNTTGSTDDQSLFYDRSLGTITNDLVYPNRMDSAVGATANDNLSVSYDAQGDVIGVGVARSKPCTSPCVLENLVYEWDELGFLARATREEKHGPLIEVVADITYAYDGAGQRVLKAVTMDGSLLYTAEIFPTLRLNGATWYPSTSQYEDDVTTESAYLAGAAGSVARVEYSTTDPAVINSGSLDNLRVLFELSDALGSTSFVIDRDTSEVVEAAAYQPYGALDSDFRTSRWGNFREQHKFTGKEDDIEVGVTYFGGRYYAANLGRWLSADPVAVHTRKGNLNVYAYASGRVFSVTDPTGLMDDNGAMLNGSSDLVMNTFGVAGAAGQLAQTVPGFDTFVALQMQWASTDPMSAGNAFLNGSANFASDPINGVANFFGVSGQVVPTFAPAQSTTNIFDALSYAAGGAVTSAAVFAGGGAALDGLADTVNLSAAFSSIGRTAAAVGDGLSAFSADTRGGLNLANLAGNAAEGAGAAGQKIALGLGDTLDEFAGQTGGSTWKQWAGKDPMNWKGAFQDVVGNPANEVHFNLTGVDSPWAGAARAARGAGGATDWELLQIQQNQGWWSRITFWNNGQAVPNPFQ